MDKCAISFQGCSDIILSVWSNNPCIQFSWELHTIIYRSVLNYACHWIQIYAAIDLEGKILNDFGVGLQWPLGQGEFNIVLIEQLSLSPAAAFLLFLLICISCAFAIWSDHRLSLLRLKDFSIQCFKGKLWLWHGKNGLMSDFSKAPFTRFL